MISRKFWVSEAIFIKNFQTLSRMNFNHFIKVKPSQDNLERVLHYLNPFIKVKPVQKSWTGTRSSLSGFDIILNGYPLKLERVRHCHLFNPKHHKNPNPKNLIILRGWNYLTLNIKKSILTSKTKQTKWN